MKYIIVLFMILFCGNMYSQERYTINSGELQNKIKGGWAGQTIGVTYGAPVEFNYTSNPFPIRYISVLNAEIK